LERYPSSANASTAARGRSAYVFVIGTLGVLRNAARANLLLLPEALSKLQQTNFYVAPELIRSLPEEDVLRRK